MFCWPWIALWENLTDVLTVLTTYMYEDLWSVETCDERSLEGPNYYTLPIQKQTTHTTATFYTTADYMVHYASGATKSKLHHSVLQSYSLQLTKKHSIILVPMEETLLHKLQSTESRSRYLQIPDCYKLSNGRFDVKHFLQVFYFH